MTTAVSYPTEDDLSVPSLTESLSDWYKLPLAAMRDVGAASVTLGALLRVISRDTFRSVEKIVEESGLPLPLRTVRRHLVTLHDREWIVNEGRQPTRSGRKRRTCTLALTAKTKAASAEYAPLPAWACGPIIGVGRLPWSAKAVLAAVMMRVMKLNGGAERNAYWECDDDDGLLACIMEMGGEERFAFSLSYLVGMTGLTRDSVATAKRLLDGAGIVQWIRGDDGETDILWPFE